MARTTAAAKKAPAKTAASAPATQAPAKKAAAKKAPAKKAPAQKTAAAAAAKAPARNASEAPPAKTTKATKAAATKPATKASTGKAPAKKASTLPAGWSAKELAAVRADLEAQLAQMRTDYEQAMKALDDLQTHGADSAGDDQADAGSKTFEREHEMSLANNRRDLIVQLEHAVERIDAGRYGLCESCGNPITKARLQAFPGATLCVSCKQREERR